MFKTGYLPNKSFSSCSDTNWPRLATNSVEHGGVLQFEVDVVEPTGLAMAVLAATRCDGGMVPWMAAWLASAAAWPWLMGCGTAN